MQLPIVLDGSKSATLQSQIFDQIRAMILEGRLRMGAPLPATRELSSQIGVSRNTAVLAYERLVAEGYVETRPHVGTYVAAGAREGEERAIARSNDETNPPTSRAGIDSGARRQIADFQIDRSDPRAFPLAAWTRRVSKRLRTCKDAFAERGDPLGLMELRRAIAHHLETARGVIADPERIAIVAGRRTGLDLVARLLVAPGKTLVVETPCYLPAALAFERFGARLHPVAADRDGLRVSMLPRVENAIAYVASSRHYPLGAALSLRRRITLLDWAREQDAYVVEDDHDGDFRFSGAPLTALKGLDRDDRTIYLGSFSKSMGPGLRLAYLALPGRLIARAKRLVAFENDGASRLEQAAMADFMASGEFARHLRKIRKLYLARRDALLGALTAHFGECEIFGAEAGTHLVWRLPRGFPDANEAEAMACDAGVGVYALASRNALHFGSHEEADRLLMLGFGALDEREISAGVARLAFALRNAGAARAI